MATTTRRYDIDWLRVIAIGLLLIYHTAIGFQSWGIMIGFIANDKPWPELWIPMTMLNVWRIPFLFFVSGMGMYFAMQHRTWKQLMAERSLRIFLPFVFGAFVIVPLGGLIWRAYYNFDISFSANPGHLWFLGNIFAYVVILSPLFYYLKRNEEGKVVQFIKKLFSTPLGLLVVVAAGVVEVMVVKPIPFELYAMTWHGFFIGFVCFFFGFCFVLSGRPFWDMLLRWRWLFLLAAIGLFILRLPAFHFRTEGFQLILESNCWILSVFAFGHKYLNKTSNTLNYLSEAAYPVYIIHMIVQSLASWLIFKGDMPSGVEFALVLTMTFVGCFTLYEFVIKRINIIRPLFGLKMKRVPDSEFRGSGS
jgi:glucan biosynthesis protein C